MFLRDSIEKNYVSWIRWPGHCGSTQVRVMMLADALHCGGGTEEFHQKPSPWPEHVLLYSVYSVPVCTVQWPRHSHVSHHNNSRTEHDSVQCDEELRDITTLQQRDSFSVVPCSVFPPATMLLLAVMLTIVTCAASVWRWRWPGILCEVECFCATNI